MVDAVQVSRLLLCPSYCEDMVVKKRKCGTGVDGGGASYMTAVWMLVCLVAVWQEGKVDLRTSAMRVWWEVYVWGNISAHV